MDTVTREMLYAYLDDALGERDSARVEKALRDSDALRDLLRQVRDERDRGEHSVGGLWRREHLTCPTREQLGSYLLSCLEPGYQDYVCFHLETVECPDCLANLADLKALSADDPQAGERHKRLYRQTRGRIQDRSRPAGHGH